MLVLILAFGAVGLWLERRFVDSGHLRQAELARWGGRLVLGGFAATFLVSLLSWSVPGIHHLSYAIMAAIWLGVGLIATSIVLRFVG